MLFVIRKWKRSGRYFHLNTQRLPADAHGVWLWAPVGSAWQAETGPGVLDLNILLLLQPGVPWVAWWKDRAASREVQLDVCLPPVMGLDGAEYTDLEIDPVRDAAGNVRVDDEDELAAAAEAGQVSCDELQLAHRASHDACQLLRSNAEPWASVGWRRLDGLLRR